MNGKAKLAEAPADQYAGTGGKIRCAVQGCKYEGHILVGHVREEHGLDPENYARVHPNAPIFSEKGRAEYEKRQVTTGSQPKVPVRKKKMFSVRETFGIDLGFETDDNGKPVIDPATGKPKPKDRPIQGFAEPTDWTPKIDESYVFSSEETLIFLMALAGKDRTLLTGGTGTGKSSLVKQIAARLNYGLCRINFDGQVTRSDLVGEWIIKGKEMVFQYGVLPIAWKMPGVIILFDEWDSIKEDTAFVLQRPLEKDDGHLLILETGGELIPLHEDNFIVATGNTVGQGDESGLYSQGTRIQNYSQINRFGITIKMNYLPPDKEKEMLGKKFPSLEPAEVDAFVTTVNKVRDGFSNGQISVPLSPRDLIQWAQVYLKLGDPMKAARYCFLNRMSTEDAQVTEGLIQRSFEEQ